MINPEELRIGNFIYDDENQIVKVEKIESNDFYKYNGSDDEQIIYSINGTMRMSSVINPIPLTEELLLKCGFIVDKSKSYLKLFLPVLNLNVEIHAIFYHGQFVIELVNDSVPIVTEATHLHHLQDLYFALTRKELEVKI